MEKAGTIEINGFELGYKITGEGEPVLIVGSSIYYPRTFTENIKKKFKMIFIDHRGFVKAPYKLEIKDYTLEVILNDIECIRKKLDLGKISILGHSGHAFMALEYAKKYPENISKVILLDVSPDYSEKRHKASEKYFQDFASEDRKKILEENFSHLQKDIEDEPEKRFIKYCIRAGAQSWYDYNFDAESMWDGVYTNMEIIDYIWGEEFSKIDIKKGLEEFNKPVFLGIGKYDFLIGPPSLWDTVKESFRDLTIYIFEKSGHTPQFEEHELFDEIFSEWMSSEK